jgi:hypothetical protein
MEVGTSEALLPVAEGSASVSPSEPPGRGVELSAPGGQVVLVPSPFPSHGILPPALLIELISEKHDGRSQARIAG